VAVRVKLPDVPVMVNVAAPMVAELLVVSVKVLVLVEFAGLKDAVTPLGRLESVRLTLPVKPFWSFTVMVLVPLLPRRTPKVLGLADSVKFGGCAAPETPPHPASLIRRHVPVSSQIPSSTLADRVIGSPHEPK
jgi:hypothetical protein